MAIHMDNFWESIPPDEIQFNADVYDNLSSFMKEMIDKFTKQSDRDVILLSALTTISGLLQNFYSIYDKRPVEPNLYSFIVAQGGGGKGILGFIRKMVDVVDSRKEDAYEMALKRYQRQSNKGGGLPYPKRSTLILPANITKTQFIHLLKDNNGRGLIFESEADTLASALFSKYGDFTDILRCGYHGEPVSIARVKDNTFIKIPSTNLATLLSGTIQQPFRVIKDYTDGLVTRFDFKTIQSNPDFNNVFEHGDGEFEQWFVNRGAELADMYEYLSNIEEGGIFFTFDNDQQAHFLDNWGYTKRTYHEKYNGALDGLVHRQALKCTKMAMVLAMLRSYFEDRTALEFNEIKCTDSDYVVATSMAETLLRNNLMFAEQFIANSANGNSGYIKNLKNNVGEKELLFKLFDEGEHSPQILTRLLGRPDSDRGTIQKWLKKGGRL